MEVIGMVLATLFVTVLMCVGILLFGSRTTKGGGLQTPPHDIPMPNGARKQEK